MAHKWLTGCQINVFKSFYSFNSCSLSFFFFFFFRWHSNWSHRWFLTPKLLEAKDRFPPCICFWNHISSHLDTFLVLCLCSQQMYTFHRHLPEWGQPIPTVLIREPDTVISYFPTDPNYNPTQGECKNTFKCPLCCELPEDFYIPALSCCFPSQQCSAVGCPREWYSCKPPVQGGRNWGTSEEVICCLSFSNSVGKCG